MAQGRSISKSKKEQSAQGTFRSLFLQRAKQQIATLLFAKSGKKNRSPSLS